MSAKMSQHMSNKLSQHMSQHMNNIMSDRMPDRMSEDMPGRMPENDKMSEFTSARMLAGMSDKMVQYLSKLQCQSVIWWGSPEESSSFPINVPGLSSITG